MTMHQPRLVPAAPRGALTIKTNSARATQHANRMGVSTMNSMTPYLTSAVVESRMEDHLNRAEHARLMRSLGVTNGIVASVREMTGKLLVRVGEWVIPRMRVEGETEDHAVVRLAR